MKEKCESGEQSGPKKKKKQGGKEDEKVECK